MSIAKHIHSLQQHLAKLGLQQVSAADQQPEVFKVCFLNKYEMQQWRRLQETDPEVAQEPTPEILSAKAQKPR